MRLAMHKSPRRLIFLPPVLALLLPLWSTSTPVPLNIHLAQDEDQYNALEALVETSRGQIVIEFFPKEAPKHVEYFVKQARDGAYDGTAFHRAIKYGIIQGGDPLTKNPRQRAQYGTGGLNAGIPDEINSHKHITSVVSAALQLDPAHPGKVKAGSSGMQFFIVIAPQPSLDSGFSVFGRVVEGMDVASGISAEPTGASDLLSQRIEIKKVTIREKSPNVEQMKAMKATVQTSLGDFKLQLTPEPGPNTARAFVRYAKAGMYDGTAFYRVSQKYFIEGGNLADWQADSPNKKRFFSLWPVPFEKNNAKHERGTVSMRQTPDGFTSWYFFIIAQDNPALDSGHVPFAKVIDGLDVIDKIAQAEVNGDTPKQRIEVRKITIE
jgi:cyclophilin family peptidyl-prolyl cis-trans isomerase